LGYITNIEGLNKYLNNKRIRYISKTDPTDIITKPQYNSLSDRQRRKYNKA